MGGSFDPERATRQQFLDALLGSLARGTSGEGYGWHFTGVHEQLDRPATVVTLETPQPLRGYSAENPDIRGPHTVWITIETERARMDAHAQEQTALYRAKAEARRELADRLVEYVGQLGNPRPGKRLYADDIPSLRRQRADVIADLRAIIADLRDDGD